MLLQRFDGSNYGLRGSEVPPSAAHSVSRVTSTQQFTTVRWLREGNPLEGGVEKATLPFSRTVDSKKPDFSGEN